MTQTEKVKVVSKILKRRFKDIHLTSAQIIHISFEIVEHLEESETPTLVEVKSND